MSAATEDQGVDDRAVAWAVTGGGTPTAAQLAAITVALTPVAPAPATGADDDGGSRGRRPRSNWVHAAIVEGIGGRPPSSLQDLVQGRFGLGHVGDPLTRG